MDSFPRFCNFKKMRFSSIKSSAILLVLSTSIGENFGIGVMAPGVVVAHQGGGDAATSLAAEEMDLFLQSLEKELDERLIQDLAQTERDLLAARATRDELIRLVVDERRIPALPLRAFKDAVKSFPDANEHTFEVVTSALEQYAQVPNDALSGECRAMKDTLDHEKTKLVSATKKFGKSLMFAGLYQFWLPQRAVELAQEVRTAREQDLPDVDLVTQFFAAAVPEALTNSIPDFEETFQSVIAKDLVPSRQSRIIHDITLAMIGQTIPQDILGAARTMFERQWFGHSTIVQFNALNRIRGLINDASLPEDHKVRIAKEAFEGEIIAAGKPTDEAKQACTRLISGLVDDDSLYKAIDSYRSVDEAADDHAKEKLIEVLGEIPVSRLAPVGDLYKEYIGNLGRILEKLQDAKTLTAAEELVGREYSTELEFLSPDALLVHFTREWKKLKESTNPQRYFTDLATLTRRVIGSARLNDGGKLGEDKAELVREMDFTSRFGESGEYKTRFNDLRQNPDATLERILELKDDIEGVVEVFGVANKNREEMIASLNGMCDALVLLDAIESDLGTVDIAVVNERIGIINGMKDRKDGAVADKRKADVLEKIEQRRSELRKKGATRIQAIFRGKKGKREFVATRQKVIKVQGHARGFVARRRLLPRKALAREVAPARVEMPGSFYERLYVEGEGDIPDPVMVDDLRENEIESIQGSPNQVGVWVRERLGGGWTSDSIVFKLAEAMIANRIDYKRLWHASKGPEFQMQVEFGDGDALGPICGGDRGLPFTTINCFSFMTLITNLPVPARMKPRHVARDLGLDAFCRANEAGLVEELRKYAHVVSSIPIDPTASRQEKLIASYTNGFAANWLAFCPNLIEASDKAIRKMVFDHAMYRNKVMEGGSAAVSVDVYVKTRATAFTERMPFLLKSSKGEIMKPVGFVKFEGENGIGPGVITNWYSEMGKQIFSEEMGIFQFSRNHKYMSLKNNVLAPLAKNKLAQHQVMKNRLRAAGRFFGHAIVNGRYIDSDMTTMFIAKLAGKVIGFEALEEYEPNDYVEQYAEMYTHGEASGMPVPEFFEGVEEWPDSKEDRAQMLDRYISNYANAYRADEFAELTAGLFDIIPKSVFECGIKVKELHEVFFGAATVDLEDMFTSWDVKAFRDREIDFHATENNGQNHPTIVKLKNVLRKFDRERGQEYLRKFVEFVTGSSRVVAGGFGGYTAATGHPFQVARKIPMAGSSTLPLPETHNCFNTIDMPDYVTEEDMETKLSRAIDEGTAFHRI